MKKNKITSFSLFGIMQAACFFVLLFSIASLFVQYYWRFELLAHFRLQYFILSLLFFSYFSLLKNKVFSIFSLVIFIINAVFVIPIYAEIDNYNEGNNSKKIKLFHSNVWSSNSHYQKLLKQISIEKPDIVILQEVTELWIENLAPIKSNYPFFIEQAREDNFGIAIYSKLPIAEHKIQHWTNSQIPSIDAKLVFGDTNFQIIATHPLPPMSKDYFDERNLQIQSVAKRAKEIKIAKIIIGDLNTTIWSPYYKILEKGTGLSNVRQGFGIIPTWPTNLLPFMIPIDHCLVSKHFKVIDVKAGENFGSDHLPLIIELKL